MTPEEQIHDLRHQLAAERDRRYTEVQAERDKAAALAQRVSEAHDDKINDRLNHIIERVGQCTTHDDFEAFRRERETTLRPLMEFVAAQQGKDTGSSTARATVFAVMTVVLLSLTAVVIWATSVKH